MKEGNVGSENKGFDGEERVLVGRFLCRRKEDKWFLYRKGKLVVF